MEAHQLRRLAVEAQVDPRTLAKALMGVRVKGMAGERIQAVLDAWGITAFRNPLESPSVTAQELTSGTGDASE